MDKAFEIFFTFPDISFVSLTLNDILTAGLVF